ncbi:adenylate kinase [Corallincola spongiicola]|uniref:Adenylate kinase n=1 Tax=Corallincola spongiicola TaxID=2520508 RepID=A0ABY1WMY4_9GAMM|nr:adenylate kinase [Corallincola spongiicola]TAA43699.1 adenylate kinase [Corallincola spongiicola]
MKKVAVFGKPGSGKSALSRALALATGIQLHHLDSIVYKRNGELVEREVFNQAHESILSSESWIIDGFGPIGSFNKRLEAADTLIYIDLAYPVSYWFVTKRLIKSLFVKPEGWPDGSLVLKGTLESYKVLRLCPKFWNDDFLSRLTELSSSKEVHVIKSVTELNNFVLQKANRFV